MTTTHATRALRLALVAALTVVGLLGAEGAAAPDPIEKCRRTVIQGAAKLARARLKALRKCEDLTLAGKLPRPTDCASDAKIADAFADARAVFTAAVAKACGGEDKQCGGNDDVTLAAMQWPSACPDLEGAGCGAALASCGDVPACVACLADAAVTRAVALVYAPFVPVDPKVQKAVVHCQKALAFSGMALADKRLQVDVSCLLQRLAGDHAAACPLPGDGKSGGQLAAVRAKTDAKVCKACGGADKACGGGDDLDAGTVGHVDSCPDVGLCGVGVTSLTELVACFDCAAGVRGDCALAGAAPGVVEYPAACAAVPPTPLPTVTPTPTLTPLTTPSATATPAPTATPVFCPAAGRGTVTTAVTIMLATGTPIGSGDMDLAYLPARVRLPAAGGDAAVTARVADLTGGDLFGKGAPNNLDGDANLEPDHIRFTLVSTAGIAGAILKVTFDRCASAALTVGADYTCSISGTVGTDGVTPVLGVTCTVAVEHAP